jgi:hypothetical protein
MRADDPVVEEWPVYWNAKSDLCLFSFEGEDAAVAQAHWQRAEGQPLGRVGFNKAERSCRRVAQWLPTQTRLAVGVLRPSGLFLSAVSGAAVVSPSATAAGEGEWLPLAVEQCDAIDLVCEPGKARFNLPSLSSGGERAGEPVPGSRQAMAGNMTLSLRARVALLFERAPIVSWNDLLRWTGEEPRSRALLAAVQNEARLVGRGAWARKQWQCLCSPRHQLCWTFLQYCFARDGRVVRPQFVREVSLESEVALKMLQSLASLNGSDNVSRSWELKVGPDEQLMADFPQLARETWGEEEGAKLRAELAQTVVQEKARASADPVAAAAGVVVAAPASLVDEEGTALVTELFRTHGVVAELELRGWATKHNVAWRAVEATCELRAAGLFSLKRSLLAELHAGVDAHYAEYFEIAFGKLVEAKSHKAAKKTLLQAFKQARLAEPREGLFRAVVTALAQASQGQWVLKSGFFD